ncbi:hypothetical protein V5O48_015837 [Marasmius crinis-equi]|uniref:Uncharacterized protein n=1 Tax=Marasmius crinis-equi TaxID=585013 RepID=A0ABR3ETG9_9AGAR
MSQVFNFGDTISRGIQDVAALLPLLGTNQCEHHVGVALQKGYIYAAATPLSIFGSLGIVKAAFATLMACTTKPFFGGKWFDYAGFGTTDSVTSMATIASGTKRYGAEIKLESLLKEQHLDDPDLISAVDYFGWEKQTLRKEQTLGETDPAPSKSIFSPWTFALIAASILSSILSITPYLYLNQDEWNRPLSWIFPAFRSFGALVCVVSVQLALQLRIHRIVQSSLVLKKARKLPLLPEVEVDIRSGQKLMEERLAVLRKALEGQEEGQGDLEAQKKVKAGKIVREELESVLAVDIMLLLYQTSLLVGMIMLVIGYVGCFNLVSQSKAAKGPYVWLGMEAFFSVLRMVLWGGNPSWAQGDTGLRMILDLKGTESSEATPSAFPLVTTSHTLFQLSPKLLSASKKKETPDSSQSFIAVSAEDFLAAATPYVGPFHRLELEGISLFIAIVPEMDDSGKRKLLCLTARRDDSDWSAISIFIRQSKQPYKVFASSLARGLRGSRSRSLQVTLEDELEASVSDPDLAAIMDSIAYQHLVQYSRDLFRHLFARVRSCDKRVGRVDVLWTLTLPPPSEAADDEIGDITLSNFDEDYIRRRKVDDSKAKWGDQREPYKFSKDSDASPNAESRAELAEYGALFESALLEIYLCIEDHSLIHTMRLSPAASRFSSWEWVQKMRERTKSEKNHCHQRLTKQHSNSSEVEDTWEMLFHELRALRQTPTDPNQDWCPILKNWESHIHTISNNHNATIGSPSAQDLFQLKPFSALQHLKSNLLPRFIGGGGNDGTGSQSYLEIISRVRIAIRHLPDDTPSPARKASEIVSRGAGSAELPIIVRGLSEKTLVDSDNDLGSENHKDHGGGYRNTLPNSGVGTAIDTHL